MIEIKNKKIIFCDLPGIIGIGRLFEVIIFVDVII
jgi:hypothetical protein